MVGLALLVWDSALPYIFDLVRKSKHYGKNISFQFIRQRDHQVTTVSQLHNSHVFPLGIFHSGDSRLTAQDPVWPAQHQDPKCLLYPDWG